MGKYTRVIIVIILVMGIVLLARNNSASAQLGAALDSSVQSGGQSAMELAKPDPGSVKPPPKKLTVCQNGSYSVGGMVILTITDLKPSYCVEAELWNPNFQIKRLPDGVGAPLSHLLFLRIYFAGHMVYEIPAGDGVVEACYALPPDKQGQFYFYDFYWERFKKHNEAPSGWEPLNTRVDTDKKVACAFTQISGVYGLIGK